SGPSNCARRWLRRPPSRTCLLKPTPCSIFASSHPMGDAQVVRLLVFRVGNLTCAAAAEVVREILPWLHTTRIPGAPPVVAGLVNVRGTLVTVVDGWKALGQPEPAARTEGGGAGTLELLPIGGEQEAVGLHVDELVYHPAMNGAAPR